MTQFVPLIESRPDAPMLKDHVTIAPPLPPVTVPESDTVAEVVVAGGAFTVRVSGSGGGPTVWRVTVTVRETLPEASVAVTVMLLEPNGQRNTRDDPVRGAERSRAGCARARQPRSLPAR